MVQAPKDLTLVQQVPINNFSSHGYATDLSISYFRLLLVKIVSH